MREYNLHGVLTPKREAYLRAVEANEPYDQRHGVVANHCIRLGWVESVVRLEDGSLHRWSDLPHPRSGDWAGERLTDEGRAILASAKVSA